MPTFKQIPQLTQVRGQSYDVAWVDVERELDNFANGVTQNMGGLNLNPVYQRGHL